MDDKKDLRMVSRRVITAGESSQNKTPLLLLDWAKACDKIYHKGLFSALTRMGVHNKLICLIKKTDGTAYFHVETDG
eukprot:4153606-Karenia_brevis.AAC.1